MLVAPVLFWLGATLLYPLVSSAALSLENVRIIGSAGRFVGLANYISVLSSAAFWLALGRSVVWVAGNAVAQTVLAMGSALILEQTFPGVAGCANLDRFDLDRADHRHRHRLALAPVDLGRDDQSDPDRAWRYPSARGVLLLRRAAR